MSAFFWCIQYIKSMSFNFKYLLGVVPVILIFTMCKNDSQALKENNNNNSPKEKKENIFSKVSGHTMGTTYNIIYASEINYKQEIDDLLIHVNNGVSTYIPSSTISIINTDSLGEVKGEKLVYSLPSNEHFENNFINSKEVFEKSNRYFDPTIMPLVNYWGFGYTKKRPVKEADKSKIEELKSTVDFSKWSLAKKGDTIIVSKPQKSKLDFSGIAKGYGVDVVAALLDEKNIIHYMVEIGGEVMVKGHNDKSRPWLLGLSKPEINAGFRDFQTLVSLTNVGMASSGNYRNYYEVNGQTYGHEINPITGYPEINKLLGTSVIANNSKMADAYATSFMVMGLEKSLLLIEELKDIEASFFIRSDSGQIQTINSSGFDKYLK